MRRKTIKGVTKFFLPTLLSLVLILSFIGECSGLDIISRIDSNDKTETASGDLVTIKDETAPETTTVEEKTEPSSETSSDDTKDETETDSSSTPTNIDPVPTTTSSSDEPDVSVETSTDENETVLLDETDNSTTDENVNSDISNYSSDEVKYELDVNYENLEYWLEKFNLSDLDKELKARLFELAQKASYMYELKLKITLLVQDNSLTVAQKRARLLRFIISTCLNERDVSTEEISLNIETQSVSVDVGRPAVIDISKIEEDIGVEKVQLVSNKDLSNVRVSIIKLKQKPEEIPLKLRKNESVYQYLDIKLTDEEEYITEEDINTLNFTFAVDVSWIFENNIDKNTVVLIRYHDGEWQNLTTRLISENKTHILYVAETPGCSTFAVVGSTLVEISEPYVSESPDIPWTIIIAITSSTTMLLGFVLVKARYIYIGEEVNNKKGKKR